MTVEAAVEEAMVQFEALVPYTEGHIINQVREEVWWPRFPVTLPWLTAATVYSRLDTECASQNIRGCSLLQAS